MVAIDHAFQTDVRLLRAVLDGSRLLILVVDGRGLVRVFNRAVEKVTGLSRGDSFQPIWELAALPAERALLEEAFTPFRAETLPSGLLFHLKSGEGPARVVDWDVRVLRDECDVPAVVLTGIDVSDRMAAEQQLRETEALQRRILDRLPAIIWTTDRELRFTFSAGGGLASLGQGSLVGTSLYSYLHTGDTGHPSIAAHLRALEGESTAFETKWVERDFQTRTEPFRDRNGNVVGAIGVSLDVTELARTARALKESEARLRRLVDANVMGIVFWREDGWIKEANQAFLQLIGFSREELLSGMFSWKTLTPPEYGPLDEHALAELRATGRCAPYEKALVAKDGTRVPVLVGGAMFEGAPGTPLAAAALVVVDLREQVRLRVARDRLLVQEQSARMETEVANARLQLLVEGSKRLSRTQNATDTVETLAELVVPGLADWAYVVHRGWGDGPTLMASAHGDPHKQALLRRLYGCSPDLAAPEGAPRVFRTGEVAQYDDVSPEHLTPGPTGWPIVGTRDPEYLHILREVGMRSMVCVPIMGRVGVDAVMMLVSASDPHRYGEDDLLLARDLAGRAAVALENGRLLFEALDAVRARDDFLAVAAHELRTPLSSLLLQIQLLGRAIERGLPDAVAARRSYVSAEAQARRLSTLIDGLLDVTRLTSNRMWLGVEEMDLCALIDGLMSSMASDFQRAGCAVTVATPDEVIGRWDRQRIEQVLKHLLINAMKFGAGFPIDVNVVATAANVTISVRDRGIGISKEDQARIFDRFERAVSTRHFGGLGLGLYVSVQILRAHQGSLRVESEPGRGACFTIDLPRQSSGTPVKS